MKCCDCPLLRKDNMDHFTCSETGLWIDDINEDCPEDCPKEDKEEA